MRMSRSEISHARLHMQAAGWLAAMPAEFQAAVLAQCKWERVAPNVALTYGGDVEGGVVGVVSGAVDIVSAIGPSDTPVAHVARGPFWFGEMPTVGHRSRTITVMSRTACEVASVPQHAIEAIMAGRPEWWRLFGVLSLEGLVLVTQIATDLLIRDSRRRCIAVLLRVAGCRKEGDTRCDAGVGQDELAAMANISRQTAGIVLRRLEAQGVLELGYRTIAVIDPAKLRCIVDV